jgi:hypothetical protein
MDHSTTIRLYIGLYGTTSTTHNLSIIAAINTEGNPETKQSCKAKQTHTP